MKINYELKWFFEIDRFAPKSYCAIHNVDEKLNKGDITQANPDELDDIDVLVYSPPCQAFSVAGKREGVKDPRGRLFYDTLPIIKAKQPKYALMENVKGLTTKGMRELFDDMLLQLESLGYNNYWHILNAKDYGIPQNRERVFIISIRKDIDKGDFEFPKPFDNKLRLKDFLEDDVDEKYYIDKPYKLLDNENNNSVCKQIAKVDFNGHDYLKRVYDVNYCSPTLPTGTGGNHEPKILEDFYKNRPIREYKEYSPSLRAERQGLKVVNNDRVRKLTPREYWRLQGFTDKDFNKAKEIKMSNTQLYKQAGNSVCVPVVEEIYKILFEEWLVY